MVSKQIRTKTLNLFSYLIQPYRKRPAATAIIGGLVVTLILFLMHVTQGAANIDIKTIWDAIFHPDGSIEHEIVRHLRLPRVTVGILAGIGLAIAGVLTQAATKNPLASPTTLGINAGAYLALTAFIIFVPALPPYLSHLSSLFSVAIVFAGGIAAALLVYAIAAAVQITPVRVALAGIAVAMVFSSLTSALLIFFNEQTQGILFWGAGSLIQSDWNNVSFAWPFIIAASTLAVVIGRRLDVLLLGDDLAKSLGVKAQPTRFSAIFIGVFLASVSVSIVGPIGFVGFVAPHLVRLMGVTKQSQLMVGSAIWGAVLLVGADIAARLLSGSLNELPAGAITAVIGSPFLIWLARSVADSPSQSAKSTYKDATLRIIAKSNVSYSVLLVGTIILLGFFIFIGVVFGSTSFTLDELINTFTGKGTTFMEKVIFDLRLPRLLVATLAGASLAVSGIILQGIARNSLAAPDLVGVTSGAALSAVLFIVFLPNPPFGSVQIMAIIGAFVTFALVYMVSWKGGTMSPIKLALVGVSVSALAGSIINVILAKSNIMAASALVWLAGSTHARGWDDFSNLVYWIVMLFPLAWIVARKLDILSLGDDLSKSLGISLERSRMLLLIIGVASAATAVSIVGTIGFVGLVAPHMARILIGNHHRKLVPLAAVLGAIIVVVADTIGRIIVSPAEVSSGIVTALIGTPYFLWLLYRSKG